MSILICKLIGILCTASQLNDIFYDGFICIYSCFSVFNVCGFHHVLVFLVFIFLSFDALSFFLCMPLLHHFSSVTRQYHDVGFFCRRLSWRTHPERTNMTAPFCVPVYI